MRLFDTVVVGAGASGLAAALSAKAKGSSVVICERSAKAGRKILASGNGRCNLSNVRLDESFYNPASRPLVREVLKQFGKSEIENFFKRIGLELYKEEGRVFPATNQSSSVLKALEMELGRLLVPVEFNFEVTSVAKLGEGFTVCPKSGHEIKCKNVILTGGGRSYPALGSDGSVYKLARDLGHRIVEPVPSAVPLVVKDPLCHLLQGQKIFADVKPVIGGKVAGTASGDLLFTKYGLSGTAILDISRSISIAINREARSDVAIKADMVPFMTKEELTAEIAKRIGRGGDPEELTVGILPNKFGPALRSLTDSKDSVKIAAGLKERSFKVTGTRGWNEADFTAGGVDTSEVMPDSLESKLEKGIYFAGEVLDVDGARGGYNLAWAWASGFVAGLTR